jgi:hypothetical protein
MFPFTHAKEHGDLNRALIKLLGDFSVKRAELLLPCQQICSTTTILFCGQVKSTVTKQFGRYQGRLAGIKADTGGGYQCTWEGRVLWQVHLDTTHMLHTVSTSTSQM